MSHLGTALGDEVWALSKVEQKQLENKLVLEKDRDQLDRTCEKRISIRKSQRGQKYAANNKKGRLTGFVISCVRTAF